MRAGYGEKTRRYFNTKNPLELIDFGGFKVFDSASVDTSVILIQNTMNERKLAAAHFKNDYKRDQPIKAYFDNHKSLLSTDTESAWYLADSDELALRAKISSMGKPLKKWRTKNILGDSGGM
jgi:hypothetical protein